MYIRIQKNTWRRVWLLIVIVLLGLMSASFAYAQDDVPRDGDGKKRDDESKEDERGSSDSDEDDSSEPAADDGVVYTPQQSGPGDVASNPVTMGIYVDLNCYEVADKECCDLLYDDASGNTQTVHLGCLAIPSPSNPPPAPPAP